MGANHTKRRMWAIAGKLPLSWGSPKVQGAKRQAGLCLVALMLSSLSEWAGSACLTLVAALPLKKFGLIPGFRGLPRARFAASGPPNRPFFRALLTHFSGPISILTSILLSPKHTLVVKEYRTFPPRKVVAIMPPKNRHWDIAIQYTTPDRRQPRRYKTRYRCHCCGFITLCERDLWDRCPVCFWEDDPDQSADPQYAGGINRVSLYIAQDNFRRFGAIELDAKLYVRAPRADEIPPGYNPHR